MNLGVLAPEFGLEGAGGSARLLVLLTVLSGSGEALAESEIRHALEYTAKPDLARQHAASLRAFLDFCDAFEPADDLPSLDEILDEQYDR